MTLEELQAALNDPASPARARLLNHLAMSPLDPAAAYQEILKGDLGGPAVQAQPQAEVQSPKLADVLAGSEQGQFPQLGPLQHLPTAEAGMQKPFEFNYANPDAGNVAGMQSAAGQLVAQEPAAGGGVDIEGMRKMLQGLGGAQRQDIRPQQSPQAPAPRGNNWNTFRAQNLETPGIQRPPTLAELLGRR